MSSTWQWIEGARKPRKRNIQFDTDVELYVGHESDIEMTRFVSTLNRPRLIHQVFQSEDLLAAETDKEEDDDASLLAVHAAHLRDIEHTDINMDPAVTRDLHEPDEPEDLRSLHRHRIVI